MRGPPLGALPSPVLPTLQSLQLPCAWHERAGGSNTASAIDTAQRQSVAGQPADLLTIPTSAPSPLRLLRTGGSQSGSATNAERRQSVAGGQPALATYAEGDEGAREGQGEEQERHGRGLVGFLSKTMRK